MNFIKVIFLGTLMLSLFSMQLAFAGFDSGNAGDAYAAEFINSGRDILQRLEKHESKTGQKLAVNLYILRKAMEQTKVTSQETVFLDGLERDAVNYPEQKLLIINRKRWLDLRKSSETKARLTVVLHEFMWLAKIDDTNFKESSPLIELLNVPLYNPSVWRNESGTLFSRIECAARIDAKTYIEIHLETVGATQTFDQGEVKIFKNNNVVGYRFKKEDVSQFFENEDSTDDSAVVGLKAYIAGQSIISINYSGSNYVDQDLLAVILEKEKDQSFANETKNKMILWKGPSYDTEDVYNLKNIVCSISTEN